MNFFFLIFFVFPAVQSGSSTSIVLIDDLKVWSTTSSLFSGFTIDASILANAYFWQFPAGHSSISFSSRLVNAAKALGPAILRVGGTVADGIYYDVPGAKFRHGEVPNPGFKYVVNETQFSQLIEFVKDAGFRLVFGLNGGPGPRGNRRGPWKPDNAIALAKWCCSNATCRSLSDGWELGNEPNLWPFNWGLEFFTTGAELADDFRTFRAALTSSSTGCAGPSSRIYGPDVAMQIPEVGEIYPLLPEFAAAKPPVDALTWHWYPLASNRSFPKWLEPNPWLPTPKRMIDHSTLATSVSSVLATVSKAERKLNCSSWLGETGGASGGGTPGVSNVFADSIWYADLLGRMGEQGRQKVVARQSLIASAYGLLSHSFPTSQTEQPRPDYFVALVFKRVFAVDNRVLAVVDRPVSPNVYLYARCAKGGRLAVMVVNAQPDQTARIELHTLSNASFVARDDYLLTADSLTSPQVYINSVAMSVDARGHPSDFHPAVVTNSPESITTPPLSILVSVVGLKSDKNLNTCL